MNKQVKTSDKLPFGLMVLSNALPPIGFYLSYSYKNSFPKKARTALINAILGRPMGLAGGYLLQTYIFV
jgi:hypothetical protein